MTAPAAGTPPPVVRIVAAPASSAALPSITLLRATLIEALRARGYRTATAERRPAGGLAVTLASGGRIGVEREVEAAELGAFVAGLDPGADLVVALGFDDDADDALPTIELTSDEDAGAPSGERLATIAEAELTEDLQADGRPSAVDGLAALLDARLLGGTDEATAGAAPAGRGLLRRLRGLARLRGLRRRR